MAQKKKIQLSKFDATGNTFLVLHALDRKAPTEDMRTYGALAKKLCSAGSGFSADGIIVISEPISALAKSDFHMDVFNADGSWAERSGNGLRSAVAFVSQKSRKKKWLVECFDETVPAEIQSSDSARKKISASIGIPAAAPDELRLQLRVGMRKITFSPVSVGNPHAVVQVRNLPADWQAQGAGLGASAAFPNGVNVEFAKVINRRSIEALVYERGVGPTASSGTGAAACVVALRRLELLDTSVKVKFANHTLQVKWLGEGEPVIVTGDVIEVFRGEAIV